jgi:hypothetical protein
MHTHTHYPPSRPGPAEDGQGQAVSRTGTARLADRVGTLPFRQLAGAGRRTFLVAAKASHERRHFR